VTDSYNYVIGKIIFFYFLSHLFSQMVLLAAFDVEAQVVGLRDVEEDVHYPITLMTKAPGFVSAYTIFKRCLVFFFLYFKRLFFAEKGASILRILTPDTSFGCAVRIETFSGALRAARRRRRG